MQPVFRISAEGRDITARIADRLLSLQVILTADQSSDSLQLVLDNRDLRLPPLALRTPLKAWLGYGTPDYYMGEYLRSELSYDLVPLRLTVRATAADFSGAAGLKTSRTRSWEDATIGEVVAAIAAEYEYEAVVAPELSDIDIEHEDQTDESDLHFLRRLARRHDAVFKVAAKQLLFSVRGAGRSAGSGRELPLVTIRPGDISSGNVSHPDRTQYGVVVASYQDVESGQLRHVEAGSMAGSVHRLRYPSATAAEAGQSAQSKLRRLNQAEATLRLGMQGRPDLYAEQPIETAGWGDGIDGLWTANRVGHNYRPGAGYSTSVDALAKRDA